MKEAEIKKQLNAIGLKATPARLAILELFSDKCHPRSAEDVHENLKRHSIDLVTVYRTLASFEEAGILRKVDLHKSSQFYELNEHHHHHIICTKCGLIEELENCNIQTLASEAIARSGKFKNIEDHSLEFFGLCAMCV